MTRKIRLAPQADADIDDAYMYIGSDNPDAAEHLIATLDNLFDLLAVTPGMGHKRTLSRAGDIYAFSVSAPFNEYLVFYRATDNALDVLRIIHGKRWTEIGRFLKQ